MRRILLGGIILFASLTVSAQEISQVSIERINVFDPTVPGEDWWPFQTANRIHIPTRKHIIEHDNLLPVGSLFDPLKAIETERNLRSLGFLRHASVRPLLLKDGTTDLQIRTQDAWTLLPQLSLGTEGGDDFLVYGISESNLLGLGKSISIFHSQVGGEIRNDLRYTDPRLLGSWNELTTQFADTNRGSEAGVRILKPFFSLTETQAWDFSWASINQEESLYQNADEISKFNERFSSVRSRFGLRVGRWGDTTHRINFGTLYTNADFGETRDTRAGTLPKDRRLSGPIVGYSWIQPRYRGEQNIDGMQRTEDYNLGNEFSLETGPMLESWGSDQNRWILSTSMRQGASVGKGRFALGEIGLEGRMLGGNVENGLFFANLNFFWKTGLPFDQTWVAHFEFNTTRLLDGERQIVLGGDTGLRGYKNNAFTGERSFLFNLENRFFWNKEIYHLLYMGGVVFFDSGVVSSAGGGLNNRVKSDVGAGLRFSTSRSSSGGVVRFDIAYALNDGPGSGRWVATIRGGHAFSLFGSSNRRARRNPDSNIAENDPSVRLRRR
ncbi:MAG: hypothetical protein COB53_09620 [Elusimicrobia bacterium]|nr:MAG: hypothetical protein COB53_09620 [Elusimicrobiota bacterium]